MASPNDRAASRRLTYDTTRDETTVWTLGLRGKWKGLWQPLFRIKGRVQVGR